MTTRKKKNRKVGELVQGESIKKRKRNFGGVKKKTALVCTHGDFRD
jgi:hypothetical protein